jgi:tRNA pseudouridine55 synthase
MTQGGPDGIVVVDKAGGWTSHDVVARMRRIAGTRKVGHAGTLDPMATGVLVVGVNRATRLLGYISAATKEYTATIRLGVRTTTDDAEGEVVGEADPSGVTDRAVAECIAGLTGDIEQVPSAVSAIKVDGKRAYARVRAGEDVQLAARPVTVSRFDVVERRGPDIDVLVECSSGTYIRALARDLGERLGVGGHLTALRRTRVGCFELAAARTLDQLAAELTVMPLADAVAAAFPRWDLDADAAVRLAHGQRIEYAGPVPSGPVGAFGPDGTVVALVEERDGVAKVLAGFTG